MISLFPFTVLIHSEFFVVHGMRNGYLIFSASFIKKPITFPASEMSSFSQTKFPYAVGLFLDFCSVHSKEGSLSLKNAIFMRMSSCKNEPMLKWFFLCILLEWEWGFWEWPFTPWGHLMEGWPPGRCCGHSSGLLLPCFSLHWINISKANVKTRNKKSLICHIAYSCVWSCNLHFNVLLIPEKWHFTDFLYYSWISGFVV